ncbi:MAG: hypothetical protein RR452_10675, partial [Clostridia bacterium]
MIYRDRAASITFQHWNFRRYPPRKPPKRLGLAGFRMIFRYRAALVICQHLAFPSIWQSTVLSFIR